METPGTRSQQPPPLDLDDPGVHWVSAGDRLQIDRRAGVLALVLPSLLLTGSVGMLVVSVRDADPVAITVFVVSTVALGGFFMARLFQRATIWLDDDALSWAQWQPRPFHGALPRRRVRAVRLHFGPKPVGWFARRHVAVELRVDDDWWTFAAGHSATRGRRLAEALALRLGVALDEHEDTRD